MLLHPAPQDVFILGLGTGVTAAAVARYPVRRIDVVDLEPAASQAARFFEMENRRVLADPRTRLITADGRAALLARAQSYNVIISDPSDVWVAGVGTLFTREFYQIARSRLRPGGVMVQWFHTHVLPPEQMKVIVSTFRRVFPHASLWRPNRGDVILLGSVQPLPWEYGRLRQRIAGTPGVEEDLAGDRAVAPAGALRALRARGGGSHPHARRRARDPQRRPPRDRVSRAPLPLCRHDAGERRGCSGFSGG